MCTSALGGPKNVPACVRGYASRRPGIFLHICSYLLCNIVRFGLNNGVKFRWFGDKFGAHMSTCAMVWSKNVPACVRGYAVRRPGIFYTFCGTLCAISYDFGSTMVSSFVNLVIRLV